MQLLRCAARRPLIACTIVFICLLLVLDTRGCFASRSGLPVDTPLTAEGIVSEPPEPAGTRIRFPLDLIALDQAPARGRVLVTAETAAVIRPGDILRLGGTLRTPPGLRNPGGFDYRTYLARQGIRTLFYADNVTLQGRHPLPWYRTLAFAARADICRTISRYLPDDEAAVLIPMIIGDKSGLTPDLKRAFADAGVTHILVVSGMNVAYCTAIFLGVFRLLGLSRRRAALATIPVILLYMLATGASAPVVRASVMALFVILSLSLAREPDIYQSLACAALAILIVDPQALFTASFQLSFAATLGIVVLYPVLLKPFAGLPRWLRHSLGATVAVSLAAQLGVLPLIAAYFNKISLIGLVSNIVVVPLTALITALGIALYLAHWIAIPLAQGLGLATAALISLLLSVVRFFAAVPGATLHVASPPILSVAAYYIVLFGVVRIRNSVFFRFAVPAVAVLWLAIWSAGRWWHHDEVRITLLDVGNGDAACIEFGGGKTWLIDGGGSYRAGFDPGEKIVCPFLWSRGVRRIDAVVVTHPHIPHYGGLAAVLRQFPVNRVLTGPALPARFAYAELLALVKERRILCTPVWAGERFVVSGSTVTVLAPVRDAGTDSDDACLVMALECHGRRVLLTADMGEDEEQRLAGSAGMTLAAMQLPNHGRRMVSQDFARKFPGGLTIVSGKRGAPAAGVSTGECGAITLIIGPDSWRSESTVHPGRTVTGPR
jgi:competence protein ComEC